MRVPMRDSYWLKPLSRSFLQMRRSGLTAIGPLGAELLGDCESQSWDMGALKMNNDMCVLSMIGLVVFSVIYGLWRFYMMVNHPEAYRAMREAELKERELRVREKQIEEEQKARHQRYANIGLTIFRIFFGK